MVLNVDQVLALAPDPAAAASARQVAKPGIWRSLGQSADALWGECQGSALYQVRVDRSDLLAKCSCPSRKFPCKHGLGLMLLAADSRALVPQLDTPDWVAEWLASRQASAETRQAKQARQAAEPDQVQQSKRVEKRLALVQQGIYGLDLWLQDLIRTGLAGIELQKTAFWERQAARLVDSQAPGLAARVRSLAQIPGSAPNWPEKLLGALGNLALLIEAFRRFDTFDEAMQADIRGMIGWTLREDEVIAHGDLVTDQWLVLGQWIEDDERLRTQRTWLQGRRSGRAALVLQFSAAGAPFGLPLVPGTELEAILAFWPSSYPLRALIQKRLGPTLPISGSILSTETIDDFLHGVAAALARQPWIDRLPFVLHDAIPIPRTEGSWQVIDSVGEALPLMNGNHWSLLAVSGGHPIDLVGEWHDGAIMPLSVASGGALTPCGSMP